MVSRSFVELLAEEASPEAFTDLVRRAERDGFAPAELDRINADLAVALRVRSKIERYRQRETELGALYATANDLTALRDVDAVLVAIVRRARQLLGADLAYLSLNDPERGDGYIRVTDGSQSAAFRALRIETGAGLIGLIAQTAAPYFSDDYLTDERFAHRGYIDLAVREEGVRAVLGVPLSLGDQLLGALLVANRQPRPFAHDEAALLGSLAAHAAIALENARLFEEAKAALSELDKASAQARSHSDALELAASADDRLSQVLLQGGGLADVAAALAEVVGGDVWVFDVSGHELARVGQEAGSCGVKLGEVSREALRRGHVVEEVEDSDGDRRWVAVAMAGADHLGTIVLGGMADLGVAERRILGRSAVVTALLLVFQRSVAAAEERVRGELLDDLLSAPDQDPITVRERARRFRTDLDRPQVVAVIRVDGVERQRVAQAAARLAGEHHGLSVQRERDVVVVVPGENSRTTGSWVADRLRKALGISVTVGVSGPVSGPASIAAAYREARQCASALVALGRYGEVADVTGLGFAQFLLGAGGRAEAAEYVQRVLGPLIDYDVQRGAQLVATLAAWFAAGGSLAGAAERLHIHPNTVSQRLERITTLLGGDWRQPARVLDVQIAVRVWCLQAEGLA